MLELILDALCLLFHSRHRERIKWPEGDEWHCRKCDRYYERGI